MRYQMCIVFAVLFGAWAAAGAETANVTVPSSAMGRFTGQEIRKSLEKAGYTVEMIPEGRPSTGGSIDIAITTRQASGATFSPSRPEGFLVRRKLGGFVEITGVDAAGAMYGGLELAEQIRLNKDVDAIDQGVFNPKIARRGVKFNIPLDARTPSYDDTGDSAQNNIETVWDFAFWERYLDEMARNRYNVLTLWNPHPFPSMVKLAAYPDCALADVCQTTIKPTWQAGKWAEPQGVTPEILKNLRVLKKMPIEEKIEFWQKVMKRAKDRGIAVYFITWNVLTNSAGGKYGIDNRQDNRATIAYMRACVKEMALTYPDLAGIGVTAGENMKDRSDEFAKEKWLWATYGEGIADARKAQPGRRMEFIHRIWQTRVDEVMKEWKAYPDAFELSFKYSKARLYSSVKPHFADSLLKEMEPHGLKSWWNLRNDDIFCFRWGDAEFVREFIDQLPEEKYTAGYYVGSDGYVWGREFTSTEPDSPRQLEIDKHWLSFMLWGRIGFDSDLSDERVGKIVEAHFPESAGTPVYEAWARASKIIPLVNRFHWRDWDFMWSVEGCMDQQKGFHTVRDFIKTPTMEQSGLVTIGTFVKSGYDAKLEKTPPQVAEELQGHSKTALKLLADIRAKVTPSKELRLTLGDIEAMAHLGNYYSEKILAAVELARFDQGKQIANKEAAIRHLQEALDQWNRYARIASSQYQPQLLARTRELNWLEIAKDVKNDIEIARGAE
jgi:hypothetical protein